MSLVESVRASLEALEPDARDGAARALALEYAAQVDAAPEMLEALGPKLLAALDALGMTPRARSSAVKGAPSAAANPLDQLRARRAERGSGTA